MVNEDGGPDVSVFRKDCLSAEVLAKDLAMKNLKIVGEKKGRVKVAPDVENIKCNLIMERCCVCVCVYVCVKENENE